MNAPTGKLTGISDIDLAQSSFYRLRSAMLDIFADIETSILNYLSESKDKPVCETAPLGQKIEAAKKVPAGPQRSKDLKTKADAELTKVAELLAIRADLVHSRMEIAITTNSNILAIFQNAKNAATDSRSASIFTLDELQKFVLSLQAMQTSLRQALTARNAPPTPRIEPFRTGG